MQPFILDPQQEHTADMIGAVICEEVKANGLRLFHKGHRLTQEDLAALPTVARPIHAVRLDPDNVQEDEAGMRLAQAIVGEGLFPKGPVQSRVNLVAEGKGLLRVDAGAVTAVNRLEGIAIFILPETA